MGPWPTPVPAHDMYWPEFIRLNEADPAWLCALPELLNALARSWSLELEAHFPEIAYNYVAPVTRFGPGGRPTRCIGCSCGAPRAIS